MQSFQVTFAACGWLVVSTTPDAERALLLDAHSLSNAALHFSAVHPEIPTDLRPSNAVKTSNKSFNLRAYIEERTTFFMQDRAYPVDAIEQAHSLTATAVTAITRATTNHNYDLSKSQ